MVPVCRPTRFAIRLLGIFVIQAFMPGVSDRLVGQAQATIKDPLTWEGPDGEEVRFSSLEELREFMQTARIRKLLLEKSGVRLHAHFQS